MATIRPGRATLVGRLALVMEVYGLPAAGAARALGVPLGAVECWLRGGAEMPQRHVEALDALARRLRGRAGRR
jgi:hypothetical protein